MCFLMRIKFLCGRAGLQGQRCQASASPVALIQNSSLLQRGSGTAAAVGPFLCAAPAGCPALHGADVPRARPHPACVHCGLFAFLWEAAPTTSCSIHGTAELCSGHMDLPHCECCSIKISINNTDSFVVLKYLHRSLIRVCMEPLLQS